MKPHIRSVFWFTGLLLGGIIASVPNAHAQFTFITNNGAITITGYTGPGGNVAIPDTTNGLPVTSIGDGVFEYSYALTRVTIGNNVTNIGRWAFLSCGLTNVAIPDSVVTIESQAFEYCEELTSVVIGNGVTIVPDYAFADCNNLTNIVIGNSVTNIENNAFESCHSLTHVTIPASVVSIGSNAFHYCPNLTSAYFLGNAPPDDGTAFALDTLAVVYYLPGTSGWGPTFGGAPTALWFPAPHLDFQTLNHQLVLNWTNAGFTLQSESDLNGTFSNVPSATSPFTNLITAPQQFFRLISN